MTRLASFAALDAQLAGLSSKLCSCVERETTMNKASYEIARIPKAFLLREIPTPLHWNLFLDRYSRPIGKKQAQNNSTARAVC